MSSGGGAVSVIRGVLGTIRPSRPLLIVSQQWPSWLVVALAHNLPIAAAAFPRDLHRLFKPKSKLSWQTIESFQSDPHPIQTGVIGVISGTIPFIRTVLSSLPSVDDCIMCVEPTWGFQNGARQQRYLTTSWNFIKSLDMSPTIMAHADYGGATSAKHVLGFGSNITDIAPPTAPNVRRGLAHFLTVRVDGRFPEYLPPPPLHTTPPSKVCYLDSSSGVIRREGLLPCSKPFSSIICPSVYSKKGFVVRPLSLSEVFRVYSIPTSYDVGLLEICGGHAGIDTCAPHSICTSHTQLPFESAVSPDILTSISHHLWGVTMSGGSDGSGVCGEKAASAVADTPTEETEMNAMREPNDDIELHSAPDVISEGEIDDEEEEETVMVEEETVTEEMNLVGKDKEVDGEEELELVEEDNELPDDVSEEEEASASNKHHVNLTKTEVDNIGVEAQEHLKEVTDQSKAAKADDAAVPVHLWNDVIREGATPRQDRCSGCVDYAVGVLREWGLKNFWKTLRKDCIARLRKNYGEDWMNLPREKDGQPTKLGIEIQALSNIMWHATECNWFEYKSGSALHYFRFPIFYQGIAKEGVRVYFEKEGPNTMRGQPPVADEKARAVLRSKVGKVIKRGYLFGSGIRLRSLIRYFAVPKTGDDYRIVYDATANKLNDAVWAPSFWLPTVDTLVRYVDANTWMMDRDMGDMFLNFPLDKRVWPYTGLNLQNLFDGTEEEDDDVLKMAGSQWVHWGRCLMGFKPSPYNSIKTAMVVEEVARGDRHCERNPFQWDHVRLNLPGDVDYDPSLSWISKMRNDGLIACDVFTFVDDERVSGATRELTWQAGHRLAYIQAYLGVQDAARKLRELSQRGGAWAGSVVHTIADVGVCVLTTEEKWKKFRGIIDKWLERVERGDQTLDHKELQSDRGFCVHVCNNYPAMKPFLKGFHLSLEMWRGNRDAEGWKLPARLTRIDEVNEEDVESITDEEDSDTDEVLLDLKLEDESLPDDATVTTASDVTEEDDATVTTASNVIGDEDPSDVDILRAPVSGETTPAKRFVDDLRALMRLSDSDSPPVRVVRSRTVVSAVYGFVDASGKGFCGTMGYHDHINYRIGVWGRDEESESSNYKELCNLVETCEEEALAGRLFNAEFFLFTDNSTAEACFYKGSSTSKLLHELVLRLRKLEMDYNLTIHVVHVAGERMIAQGTDGGSRGSLLEGVLSGKPMLEFVDLAKTAIERHEPLLDWIRSWTDIQSLSPMTPEEWFVEAHGICGGKINADGIWMPVHEKKNQAHLWCPPPAVADAALEEVLKARHKRSDTYHIILIPRLMTPRWRRLYRKVVDFSCEIPAGSPHWPSNMFEPLWLGIVLPFSTHRPWQLKRAPLILEMEREMRQVLRAGGVDGGWHILRKLWTLNSRLSKVSADVARQVLRMPRGEDGS